MWEEKDFSAVIDTTLSRKATWPILMPKSWSSPLHFAFLAFYSRPKTTHKRSLPSSLRRSQFLHQEVRYSVNTHAAFERLSLGFASNMGIIFQISSHMLRLHTTNCPIAHQNVLDLYKEVLPSVSLLWISVRAVFFNIFKIKYNGISKPACHHTFPHTQLFLYEFL